jgi:hypothetical protein
MTTATRFISVWSSSNSLAAHVDTDAGEYVIKVANNPDGPRVLVNEWIGCSIASLLGLLTPDFAIVNVPPELGFELKPGLLAVSGLAFGSRFEQGQTWGGRSSVRAVANQEAFSRLVVFDTWLLNVDRYSLTDGKVRKNVQNLWLSQEGAPPRKFLLKAIDHGYCFRGPSWRGNDLKRIESTKDPRIFGMFPEFVDQLEPTEVRNALGTADAITGGKIREIVDQVPTAWQLLETEKGAVIEFLLDRLRYLKTTISEGIWPQKDLRGLPS